MTQRNNFYEVYNDRGDDVVLHTIEGKDWDTSVSVPLSVGEAALQSGFRGTIFPYNVDPRIVLSVLFDDTLRLRQLMEDYSPLEDTA